MTAEIRELLPLYALNALAAEEHLRLEAHLEDCAECQSELRELRDGSIEGGATLLKRLFGLSETVLFDLHPTFGQFLLRGFLDGGIEDVRLGTLYGATCRCGGPIEEIHDAKCPREARHRALD